MQKTFTFDSIPSNVEELMAVPEATLDDAFATAAITVLVLCNYEKDPENTIAMINYLKGPQELSAYEKSFLRDRLVGKYYVPRSFFAGATVDNNYEPSAPYTVTVEDNTYSYAEENYMKLYLKSSGADSPRPIQLREVKSTGKWYLWENALLADIRRPKAEDPWA